MDDNQELIKFLIDSEVPNDTYLAWNIYKKEWVANDDIGDQLWAEILAFNDEQDALAEKTENLGRLWSVSSGLLLDNITLHNLEIDKRKKKGCTFRYTDIDSMKLALVKVCCEIWKLKQEAQK